MNEENDITKTATSELLNKMIELDNQIELLNLYYEKVRLELIKRYPMLINNVDFQPKLIRKTNKGGI